MKTLAQRLARPHPKGFIRAPTEDSLNERKTNYLTNHGWDYRGKKAYGRFGPGYYKGQKAPSETDPAWKPPKNYA